MKRVIDGKRYDTERAQEIGSWWNGYGNNDFKYCAETLYITAKGNYFLAGNGGAMSKYAESHGNSTCGGCGIFPLSREEAFLWAQENLEPKDFQEHFSDMIEDA